NLTGGALNASLDFVPRVGTEIVLIANDGTDAVVGTFAGLPEGTVGTLNGILFSISYRGGDGNDVTLTAIQIPAIPQNSFLAVGAGAGGGSAVQVFGHDGSVRSAVVFEGFNGEVHVATGDVTGDTIEDIIVGAGPGASGHVKVFDGATGTLLHSFFAFTGF